MDWFKHVQTSLSESIRYIDLVKKKLFSHISSKLTKMILGWTSNDAYYI